MNWRVGNAQSKFVIYEWKSSEDYLIRALLPRASTIAAVPGDSAARVKSLLPPDTTDFFFHLGLSDMRRFLSDREGFLEMLRSARIRVWNGSCVEATKRSLHQACKKLGLNCAAAAEDGPGRELLIVKTNYNCGGLAESWLTPDEARLVGLPIRNSPFKGPLDYKVARRSKVMREYWKMRGVVVERYISRKDNRIFRGYVVGNSWVLSEGINPAKIKKMYPGIHRKNHCADLNKTFRPRDRALQAVHEQMRGLVPGLNLDFAAIDLVCDDRNTAFAVDVNLTPHWGGESQPWLIRHLRRGLVK